MADLINKDNLHSHIDYPILGESLKKYTTEQLVRIRNAILSGLQANSSIRDMAKNLNKSLGIGLKNALRIARTETHRITELGHYAAYRDAKKQGIEMKRKLIATLDDRTRAQSAQMDGQISNDEGLFKYPNDQYYLPGQTGHPEWDINDREVSIEIIEGYEPNVRRQREKGIIPEQSFQEWAKEKGLTKNRYGEILFT